ncbi:MAG: ATP-dependent Clp protease proteolytic subunit [Bacteroidales bacterium]
MKSLLLYGYIGDETARNFYPLVEQAEELRINSFGGEVFAGLAIYYNILTRGHRLPAIIDGVAASMATIVACACEPVGIRRGAMVMLHSPTSGVWGNKKDVESELHLLNAIENTLAAIYAQKMGITAQEVKDKYFDGNQHWFTSKEAVAIGIADMEIDEPAAQGETPQAIYSQTNNTLHMKSILMKLGLKAEAPEAEAIAKVEALQAENAVLKSQVDAYKAKEAQAAQDAAQALETEAETAVAQAVREGRIVADMHDTYKAMYKVNPQATKKIIESLPVGKILTGSYETKKPYAGREDWTFKDWQAKDGKGLALMQKNDPEMFRRLREAM